jgi:hypothetical protein
MFSLRTLAAGLAVAAAITTVATTSAVADTTRYRYVCTFGISGWQEDYFVTVNAPATVHQGDTVTLTGTARGTIPRDGARPAGSLIGGITLVAAGAASGYANIDGMASPAAQSGDPFSLVGGSGQITLNNVGTVTLAPHEIGFASAQSPMYGFGCFDFNGPTPVTATIQVLPR